MASESGEVLQISRKPASLVHGLLQRLAHFLGIGASHELLVLLEQLDELHQIASALDRRNLLPRFLGFIRGVDGRGDIFLSCHGEQRDDLFSRGVDVLPHLAIAVVEELAIDEKLCFLHSKTS